MLDSVQRIWYVLLLPFGVAQQALASLGLVTGPVQILRTFPALVGVLVYEHLPFAVLILVSSLQGVPTDKINAARLLGAGTLRSCWDLILPLTMPGLVACAILVFCLSTSSAARSFWLATAASVVAVVVALPCAFAVQRGGLRGRNLIETSITSPRMIPQIVLVLGLLVLFERLGLAETFLGLVVAHLIVTIPFVFHTLLVSVATLDRRLEWSSAVLGAPPWRTFLSVVAPQLKTGLIAALIFAFILSFNNVTMALFLSGIGQRTLPVEMFQRMYVGGMTPAIPAIGFTLAAAGVAIFIVLDRTIGVYRYLAARD